MYAVIQSGGRQHRVQVGDVVHVDRLSAAAGDSVEFDRVLLVADGGAAKVGAPTVEGAKVRGTVVGHERGDKVVIYTFKRRQNSNRRRAGHRQDYTTVKIEAIDG